MGRLQVGAYGRGHAARGRGDGNDGQDVRRAVGAGAPAERGAYQVRGRRQDKLLAINRHAVRTVALCDPVVGWTPTADATPAKCKIAEDTAFALAVTRFNKELGI